MPTSAVELLTLRRVAATCGRSASLSFFPPSAENCEVIESRRLGLFKCASLFRVVRHFIRGQAFFFLRSWGSLLKRF